MRRLSGGRKGKIGENNVMAADKSQKQERGDRWRKEWREKKFIVRHHWISVISRIRSWNLNFEKSKVESCSEVTLWRMVQDHTQHLLNKDHQHHRWQQQKSWTLNQDYQDAQDNQQRQYSLIPRSKWKMHRRLLKIRESECPDIWIRLARHKWSKSWSSMVDPVVPLERNLYCHPFAGLLWERQFENVLFQYGWEKVLNRECCFVNWERLFLDDKKLAGKKQNINPTWKVLMKDVHIWRTNIIPRPCLFGLYSKRKSD